VLGFVLESYVDRNVCHESVCVCIQDARARKPTDVALCLQAPSPWNRAGVKRGQKIRKLVLGKPDTPISRLAEELLKFHGGSGRRLIALKLQLPNRSESWLNPALVEKFAEIKRARRKLNAARNNGGKAINFYSKTLRLLEADVIVGFGETSERLAVELHNFRRRFEFC
jgi:hypothetical protein